MHLLTRMDYTEAELEKKLMKGEYTPQAVKIAMDYVRSYHYLDDERYVARYLSAYQGRKSRRQMQFELERKGIPREMIQRRQEALDDEEGCVDETDMIRQLLEKYDLVPKRGASLAAATVRGLILTVSHREQIGKLYPQVLETLVYGACRELFE